MIILSEKRVQILSVQLRNYHKAIRHYYAACSTLLLRKTPIDPKEHDITTDEFRDIISETTPTTTPAKYGLAVMGMSEEDEKNLVDRLSSGDI